LPPGRPAPLPAASFRRPRAADDLTSAEHFRAVIARAAGSSAGRVLASNAACQMTHEPLDDDARCHNSTAQEACCQSIG
jgi:hypothetical protein